MMIFGRDRFFSISLLIAISFWRELHFLLGKSDHPLSYLPLIVSCFFHPRFIVLCIRGGLFKMDYVKVISVHFSTVTFIVFIIEAVIPVHGLDYPCILSSISSITPLLTFLFFSPVIHFIFSTQNFIWISLQSVRTMVTTIQLVLQHFIICIMHRLNVIMDHH